MSEATPDLNPNPNFPQPFRPSDVSWIRRWREQLDDPEDGILCASVRGGLAVVR
jgi:hypothetical protein